MSRPGLLMIVLLIAGCSADTRVSPFEPQMDIGQGAGVLKPEIRVPVDNTVPASCLGENLRFTGVLVARGYIVSTPSGLTRQHMFGVGVENGRVVGVPSGTEWTTTHFVLRNVQQLDGGDMKVLLAMEHDWMENAAGDRLRASNHVTAVFNAQGEMVSFRWEIVDCKLFPAR